MQFKALFLSAVLSTAGLASPTTPPCFPGNIQNSIQSIQNAINTIINDLVQSSSTLTVDYTSTGRSVSYLEHHILPYGCAKALPPKPTSRDQAISYLQNTQLTLSFLAQDAINSNCPQGKKDLCTAVNLYNGVGPYVLH